ncbi:MAG: hypothetical protein DMF23_12415, partial [Verrucomicrobia bacterium]
SEGEAGATTSPPCFDMCATASAAVPTKKSMPSMRFVANGEDIVKTSGFYVTSPNRYIVNRYIVAAAIR